MTEEPELELEIEDLTEEDSIKEKEKMEMRKIRKEKHDVREVVNRKLSKEFNYHWSIQNSLKRRKIDIVTIKIEAERLFGPKKTKGGYTNYSAEEIRNAIINLVSGSSDSGEITLVPVAVEEPPKDKPKSKSVEEVNDGPEEIEEILL
jgi:hypothetical protein